MKHILLCIGIVFALWIPLHGQNAQLTRSVIAGGAAVSSNGQGGITGTIGQAVVGSVTSSAQWLGQGFWYSLASTSTSVRCRGIPVPAPMLGRNHPNPFGPGTPDAALSTRIEIVLPSAGHVVLGLYDLMGRLRTLLRDERLSPGTHTVRISSGRLPPGVYICRLEASGTVATRRIVLVR